ncbi:MAG TPA: thioredoxin family protein [Pirellulaceae bacterium]|nr:thioredoxin family protein [Pirellulaceae bacterium]
MSAFSAGIVVHIALLAGGAQPYEQAQKQAAANGQPLLVLVGTDWCPGCRTMKDGVLARMSAGGRLAKVNYTMVNADRESDLAAHLIRGNAIPQLIVFSKRPDGEWHREQITGTASETQVAALIERARAAQAAKTARPTSAAVGGN